MIKKKYRVLFYLLFITLLVSCTKPNQYFTRDRYIVTTNNLNIRIDPTRLSGNIGNLSKGDTVIALASDKYWIMIKVDDQTGFVSNEYLKKIGPIATPKLFSFIERNSDWGKWQFWVISIILIGLWISAELGLIKYENHLKKKFGVNSKRIPVTPIIFFVSGILIGVLYLYWKDQVIESLFYNFSFSPKGMGNMGWIIWIQGLAIALGIIVDFIGSLYRSGIKYGHITFLMEQGINLVLFTITLFLTISLFVVAIIFLIILFAILYTIAVTENSKSFSGFIAEK